MTIESELGNAILESLYWKTGDNRLEVARRKIGWWGASYTDILETLDDMIRRGVVVKKDSRLYSSALGTEGFPRAAYNAGDVEYLPRTRV